LLTVRRRALTVLRTTLRLLRPAVLLPLLWPVLLPLLRPAVLPTRLRGAVLRSALRWSGLLWLVGRLSGLLPLVLAGALRWTRRRTLAWLRSAVLARAVGVLGLLRSAGRTRARRIVLVGHKLPR
jgi:hypothetical protein